MKIPSRILFLILVLAVVSASTANARPPRQQLLLPLPLDLLDSPEQTPPVDLELRVYTLPEDSRVEWYRLSAWRNLTERVAVGGGVSYAGVQSERGSEYGGGPAWVAISTHFGPAGAFGFALDMDGTLPLGDENLFPVASDASSIGLRLRCSGGRIAGGRSWLGWYTRRVSPPPQNVPGLDRPDSSWPSASGLMVAWQSVSARSISVIQARYDMAGAPKSVWIEGELSWFPVSDFGLKFGASVSTGPWENRPMDWGWLLGVRWRPQPKIPPDGIDSSGK